MGYDAFVRCNCREEGKTKPYPFDFQFEWDDQHRYPVILSPECEDKENWEPCDEQENKLWRWMKDACAHPNMRIAHVRLANMSGMSAFRWALNETGKEYYSALINGLPVNNGGSASSEYAAQMLADLEKFATLTEIGTATNLIDTKSGIVIRTYDNLLRGAFYLLGSSGIELGLDQESFFIKNSNLQEVLFRAMRFEQKPTANTLDEEQSDYFTPQENIEFINLDIQESFIAQRGISHEFPIPDDISVKIVYPRYLHIEHRNFGAEQFQYITEPLIEVCRASIATGNPIQWT